MEQKPGLPEIAGGILGVMVKRPAVADLIAPPRAAANVYFFDVGLARVAGENDPRRPQLNPFDQLPDKSPATLDIVTQEQVNAFSGMSTGLPAGRSVPTESPSSGIARSR